MSASVASVVVAIVGAVAGVFGAAAQQWRSRRREHIDIVAQWEQSYGAVLARLAAVQEQLSAETEARIAMEGKLARALVRIDYLERRLGQAGVEFNGPSV